MALFADDRGTDDPIRSEMLLQSFEDTQPFGDRLIPGVAVDACDIGVVAGKDLTPPGLRVRCPPDVDVHQRALARKCLEVWEFTSSETLIHMGTLCPVPSDEDDVPGGPVTVGLREGCARE